MEKVRRRLMTLLLSLAVIISYMPMSMITAYAAAGDTPPHTKKVTDNQNGTYTISLDIVGESEKKPNNVNVIVIFDRSGSMGQPNNWQGQPTNGRLNAAKTAVNNLANSLFAYNTTDAPNTVQMALVDFSTTATSRTPTNSYDTFSGQVNSLSASGGTNWEDALQDAANVNFGDDDQTFVIFVSDGNPTFRNTRGSYNPMDDAYYGYPYNYGVYGNGSDSQSVGGISAATTISRCYNHAVDDAQALVDSVGADHFFTIGAYGNVDRMEDLTDDAGSDSSTNYYSAADTTALNQAMSDILAKIETVGFADAEIDDGTTNNVTTSSGDVAKLLELVPNFKYYRSGGTYGSMQEWTDAPEAEIVDGEVVWDLSDEGVLENGVRYTVTFDCYPSQETYDIIAQLKNGDMTDADLAEQGLDKYIVKKGNDYALRTNTNAGIKWDDTRDDEGPQESAYTNPDPVATSADSLPIKKEWQGANPDVSSVPITVMMDDEEFHTVTLSSDNNWEDSSFISVGIIKGDEALPGAKGHDFSFAELDDTQYHWEIDAPVVRPMLINGGGPNHTPTMLIKVDEKHPAPSGATTYTIDGGTYYVDEEATGLTATNHRRSNLNLRKDVTGEDKPKYDKDAGIDERDTFPFTLTVNNGKAPESAPEDDDEHNSDYWVWFSIYDTLAGATVMDADVSGATGPNSSGYYYAPSGSAISVEMKEGWNLRFINLPTGSDYTFEEGELEAGYEFKESKLTDPKDGKFTGGQTSTGSIDKTETSYQVVYTNDYALTDLEITKTWDDNDDQDGKRPSVEDFAAMLTLDPAVEGAEPTVVDNENGTYTITYTDLPRFKDGEEVTYKVTESTVEDYDTPEYTNDGGETDAAYDHGEITNTHTPEKTSVTVIKEWNDSDNIGNIRPTSIQAQLYADGTASGSAQTLNAGNEWTYTWENLPKYKNGTEIVYTADETAVPTGYEKSGPEKSTAEDGTVTFTVTNTYNPTPVRKAFKATKTTSGYPADGKDVKFTFTLTPTGDAPGTAQTKELTLSGAKPSGEVNFDEIEFTKPGVFEYTVAETKGTADGWTYATNTYTVTVTVTDDGTGKLTATVDGGDSISFNNAYKAEGTEVTFSGTKTLIGRELKANEFSFTLKDEKGNIIETVSNAADGKFAFKSIGYDKVGTFKYTIEEENTGLGGVTYSTKVYEVTVTVTDDGSGKLEADITGLNKDGSGADFENSYSAKPTSVKFSGAKSISGYPKDAAPVTFEFTLTGDGGVNQTRTTSGEGTIEFDAITLDAVGEYKYTIAETKGSAKGWTYSEESYDVTVTVADDGAGQLTATITGLNQDGSGANFKNTYKADPAEVTIVGKKVMKDYGKPLEGKEFSFTIKGTGEVEKQEAEEQNTDDQATEEQPTDQAAEEQSAEQATEEQPADQASEEQPADQASEEQPTEPAPTDEAAEDSAEPAEDGDTLTGAVERIKGYFVVYALDETETETIDAPLPENPTVQNDAEGYIEFGTIKFERAGTYTYEITESGSMPGVDNDPEPTKKVIVEVTDDGSGQLTAEVKPAGSIQFEFENTYNTPPTPSSITDQIPVTKKLTGHKLEEGFFTFELKDGNDKVVATATNDAEGNVVFPPITFTKEGIYTYKVSEKKGSSSVINYDGAVYTATAKVTNNYDGNDLVIEWTFEGGDTITFTNTYSDVVAIDPPVQKIVEGSPDTTETYTFMLEAVTAGAPMPAEAGGASSMTMNITGTGAKEFGVIKYTEPGEYTYKVTEVAGSNPDCEYDGSVYTVTAKVTEDPKTYKLSVKTTYTKDGAAVDTAVFKFVNTYPDEPDEPDEPDTGDTNDLAGMLGLMGASAAGLLYMFFRRRREEYLD